MKKRLPAVRPILCAAGLAAVLGVAVPSAAQIDDPQQKLKEIEKARSETRAKERAHQQEVEKLQRETARIKNELVKAAAKMRNEEEAMTEIEDRLAELAQNERGRAFRLEQRRTELAGTLEALARLSRTPPEAMIASPQSALDSFRASLLLSTLIPEIEARAAALKTELAALADLRRGMEVERQKFERANERLAADRQNLERLLAERSQAQAQALEQSMEAKEKSQQLEAEARDLKALIAKLEEERQRAEEERRRAQAEAARIARAEAEAARQAKAEADRTARAEAERVAKAESEARLKREREALEARPRLAAVPPIDDKGALAALPAGGKLVQMFGQTGENGILSRGVSVETRPAAQVIAPGDGKIVFAGPFRGYGQLLIIAHAGEYHSLLAGFARIDGAVGQSVLRGEPVGSMGGSDGQRPVLYLELRHKGEAVNPLPWLAASGRKVSG